MDSAGSCQCECLAKRRELRGLRPQLPRLLCVFVHLCLCSSKIKTQAYSLIRPLSRSRAWRRNGVGTMTPRRRRLTPSPWRFWPHHKTGPHLRTASAPPAPPIFPLFSNPNPAYYKRNCQDRSPPAQTLRPMCCHRPWGYPAKTIGPPKKMALCVSFSFIHHLFSAGQMTQCSNSHRAGRSPTVGSLYWPMCGGLTAWG